MARHLIQLTDEAKLDLAWSAAPERKVILDGIREQLVWEPVVQTRNRKPVRDESPPRWELRVGKYRVLYEVDEASSVVRIGAVGYKEHNVLYVRGHEVGL